MTLALALTLAACSSNQMTLDEASEMSIELDRAKIEIPVRSVSDVIGVLRSKIESEAYLRNNTSFPGSCSDEADQDFVAYLDKGVEKAISLPLKLNSGSGYEFNRLHRRAFSAGYFEEGMEIIRRAKTMLPHQVTFQLAPLMPLIGLHLTRGEMAIYQSNFSVGLENLSSAQNYINQRRGMSMWGRIERTLDYNNLVIEAERNQIAGRLQEAELQFRQAISMAATGNTVFSLRKVFVRSRLIENLLLQHRLLEAEVEVRQALESRHIEAIEYAAIVSLLTRVLFEQGRYQEALEIAQLTLVLLDAACVPKRSVNYAMARETLALVHLAEENWKAVSEQFDLIAAEHGQAYPDNFERQFVGNLDWGLARIFSGSPEQGIDQVERAYDRIADRMGDDHFETALTLGYLGIAYLEAGRIDDAEDAFEDAIPVLIDKRHEVGGIDRDSARERRLRTVLEGYMKLLSRELEQGGQTPDPDIVEAMFFYADIARSGTVHGALAAANARAVKDPELAKLVRQEQDTRRHIKALQALVLDYKSRPLDEVEEALPATLAKLEEAQQAHRILLDAIERDYPAYVDRLYPRAGTVRDVRLALNPDEALIALYVARDQSYVWSVPKRGHASVTVVPKGERQISGLVKVLRLALEPDANSVGDIPPFNLDIAHDLYVDLLDPLKSVWGRVEKLVVVNHGPLSQIPLGVLPTERVNPAGKVPYFSEYQSIPWLVKHHVVWTVPSISTFREQRDISTVVTGERKFIGFGDPIFDPSEAPITVADSGTDGLLNRSIKLRSSVETRNMTSATIADLSPLPDTADEVTSIAKVLGADLERDVFLGARANEDNILEQPLEKYQVITFATHGLLPGDINGLTQPALAFSNPNLARADNDGLLTLDEVLSLKLNADWVVLSACNTGAGDGAGSEAISGLGRAFFYAGAKSLLVTHWPVETTSARELTTTVFKNQANSTGESRARSLQKAQHYLIDGPGYQVDGETLFSYAHPIFWAPFALVGEGG